MLIIQTMIIKRKEIKKINSLKAWTLVFGRRKTGKTFLVHNFVRWDDYFFVRQDHSVIYGDKNLTYDTFIQIFLQLAKNNKIMVIDEFHRLPPEFFDYVHFVSPDRKGRLILVSSTLCLAKSFFSRKSPLLGLFAEMPISIISLDDTLSSLAKANINPKSKLEIGIFLREPLVIPLFHEKVAITIGEIVTFSKRAVPALVGEIFSEEQRTLSSIYEGVLRAIASGKAISGEISTSLFAKKLIPKDDPSYIQQYLYNLMEFGLVRKIPVFNRNKYIYKHCSPLIKLFYLADEKYNLGERELSLDELQEIVLVNLPLIIEDNVREFLSQKLGLTESIAEGSDYEVDGLLLKFKKPEVALEVKWKKSVKKEDIEKAIKNLNKFTVKRKILFVPDKKMLIPFKEELKSIEIMDVNDLEK